VAEFLIPIWPYLAAGFVGYLAGSIPFGQILADLAGLGDLRRIGSGNIGATNVLRAGHRGMAAATLLLDGAKGAPAVLLAAIWGSDLALIAGACAVIGHILPVWLRFQGGKGVATTIGVLLAMNWHIGLLVMATWLGAALLMRISSLSAIIALALAPVYAWWLGDAKQAALALGLAILVIAMHRANIRRLLAGEEPRIRLGGQSNDSEPPGSETPD
jgi:glycerol-3-phosphate acyltransferase PlsY